MKDMHFSISTHRGQLRWRDCCCYFVASILIFFELKIINYIIFRKASALWNGEGNLWSFQECALLRFRDWIYMWFTHNTTCGLIKSIICFTATSVMCQVSCQCT